MLLSAEQAQPIGRLVKTSGLNSGEVLATLSLLEMKGVRAAVSRKAVHESFVVERDLLERKRVSSCTRGEMHPKRGAQHLESAGEMKSGAI